jgi:hypothetical protein
MREENEVEFVRRLELLKVVERMREKRLGALLRPRLEQVQSEVCGPTGGTCMWRVLSLRAVV